MMRPPSQRAVVNAVTFAVKKMSWIALRANVTQDVREELLEVAMRLDRLLERMPLRK